MQRKDLHLYLLSDFALIVEPSSSLTGILKYTGSTDFWDISFAFSSIDRQATSGEALEREPTLMRACWAFFDDVRLRVSAELQRGAKSGPHRPSYDRYGAGLGQEAGVLTPQDAMPTSEGLHAHRDAYCNAIRALHSQSKMARTWPLPFLMRHTAFHTLDHAWEMEDKDLTPAERFE